MKFVVDMNLSPGWRAYLNSSGHDAVHWSTVGRQDAPDVEIMRWATDNDRIVLTNDLDFGAILASSNRQRPSVVQLRADVLGPDHAGPAVAGAVEMARAELEAGALLTVDMTRFRARILPFATHS